MSDFIKGLWPRGPFTWLGLILGAMSVLALIEYGFDYGFGPTFTLLLTYYDNLIHALVGWWAEPIIEAWLADLSAYFGWDLHLYPHWKHVFVLMEIYLLRDASLSLRIGHQGTALFDLMWGLFIAGTTSISVGVMVLTVHDQWANFVVAAVPILGVAIYRIGSSVWHVTWLRERDAKVLRRGPGTWAEEFSSSARYVLRDTFVGIALILLGLQAPGIWQTPSPGLIVLASIALLWTLNVLRTSLLATRLIRAENEPWVRAFWRTGAANLGTSMLGLFFWTGLFIAANAGLRFYGL